VLKSGGKWGKRGDLIPPEKAVSVRHKPIKEINCKYKFYYAHYV